MNDAAKAVPTIRAVDLRHITIVTSIGSLVDEAALSTEKLKELGVNPATSGQADETFHYCLMNLREGTPLQERRTFDLGWSDRDDFSH